MSDLISRQAAIDYCETLMNAERVQQTDDWGYGRERYNQTECIMQYIENMPSAEPKRGRWIPVDAFTAFGGDEATWMANGNPTAFHYCSVCKGQAYAGEDGESLLTDFCPNCGADMRGD